MKKITFIERGVLNDVFNFIIKHISSNKWIYKLILIVVSLVIITMVVYNYTLYIASLKYNECKEEKRKRINKFTEEFKNSNDNEEKVEGFDSGELQEVWLEMLQTNLTPFSFSNYNKNFGYLYGNDDFTEGFNPLKGSDWRNFFNQISDGFNKVGDIFNKVGDAFKEIEKVRDWILYIVDLIKGLGPRFTKLGNGIKNINVALYYMVATAFSDALPTIGTDVFSLVYGGGECLAHFAKNFRSCLLYWLMDYVSEVIYSIFVLLPVYVFDALFPNLNLNSWVKEGKRSVEYVDEIIVNMIGYSCIHYPESILNDCYRCDVDFSRKVRELNEDTTRLNTAFEQLAAEYRTGWYQVGAFFR